MKLAIPDPSLVLLIGPSGAGKSTFAERHFDPREVLSSDDLRARLSGDADDQTASGEAFHVLGLLLNGRLKRRLLSVVDATNLRSRSRRRWLDIAARHGLPSVAIAFDFPADAFQQHNRVRTGRRLEEGVVAYQAELMPDAMAALPHEGYARLYVLRDAAAVAGVEVERLR